MIICKLKLSLPNIRAYKSGLEERFARIGAGKTFLCSIEGKPRNKSWQKFPMPSYEDANVNSKWDFRFLNYAKALGGKPKSRKNQTMKSSTYKTKYSNVELREGKGQILLFKGFSTL